MECEVGFSWTSESLHIPTAELEAPCLRTSFFEEHWYAAYTNANHEKRVAEQLSLRGVTHFMPTFSSVRKWKDRRVTIELPLFPGYVFVRMALRNRMRVLQVPSIVRLVGFDGMPIPLPDEEIEVLRSSFSREVRVKPHPFLTVGRRVRITGGPFVGLEGLLKGKRSHMTVVVSINLIQRSVAVQVDVADVAPAL